MSLRNKKVLVTGAAGFLGMNLVERLVAEGANVTTIDKRPVASMQVRHLEIDLANPSPRLRQIVEVNDIIFHLAAYSSAHMFQDFETPFNMNVQSLLHVLDYAAKSKEGKRVVFPSSSTVYGGTSLPWTEGSIVDAPVNWYAASKITGELLCKHYSQYKGLETVMLRIFCGYGPGEQEKGIYASPPTLFIRNMISGRRPEIWGDGSQERDFVYVDDIVEALVLAATTHLDADTFNVGTGVATSFMALVSQINAILGADLVPNYIQSPISGYLQRTLADMSKAEKLLEFTPRITLKEGLTKTISSIAKSYQSAPLPASN